MDLLVGQTATQELAGTTRVTASWQAVSDCPINPAASQSGAGPKLLFKWSRERSAKAGSRTTNQRDGGLRTYTEALSVLIADPSRRGQTPLPMLGYYGTGRLWWVLKDTQSESWSKGSRFRGYLDCLNPASDQKTLLPLVRSQRAGSAPEAGAARGFGSGPQRSPG